MVTKTDQIAGGIVQVLAAISSIVIFIADKGLGLFSDTLPNMFYIALLFVALGAKLKDAREILLKIIVKK